MGRPNGGRDRDPDHDPDLDHPRDLRPTPGSLPLRSLAVPPPQWAAVVGREGLEPSTYGLKVRSSTD